MKRLLTCLFLVLTMIFAGCDMCIHEPYSFDYQTLTEQVVGVEIHYIDSDSYIEETIYVLSEDEIPSFLEAFDELSFCTAGPAYPSVLYYFIKLSYSDGSYDYLGSTGGYRYDAKGEFAGPGPFFSGNLEGYYNLLLRYIEIEREDFTWDYQINQEQSQ